MRNLFLLIFGSLLPITLAQSGNCASYGQKFEFLFDRGHGDYPCVYVSTANYTYLQGGLRCLLEIEGEYAEPAANEIQTIANQLQKLDIDAAFTGCCQQGSSWVYYGSGDSCADLDPDPYAATVPHDPTSMIMAIDGTSKSADKMVEFAERYFQHSQDGGTTELVAFVFGCKGGTSPKQSYTRNFDFSKLKTQVTACVNNPDPGYTLSRLLSDIAYYFYSPYPSVYPSYKAQPVIIMTSRTNATGVVPLTQLNKASPVTIVYSGTATQNLKQIASPSTAVFGIDFSENPPPDEGPLEEGLDQVLYINPSKALGPNNDAAGPYIMGTFVQAKTGKLRMQNISSQSLENPSRRFLCQKAYYTETDPPNSQGCPSDMTTIGQRCYQLDTRLQAYQDALQECKNLHRDGKGSLAIVTTPAEMEAIKTLIQNNRLADGQSRFWIGLNAINCTGNCLTDGPKLDDFSWSNGEDLQQNNDAMFWRQGFPRSFQDESCGAYVQNDVTWVNMVCDHPLMAICWRDAKVPVPTTQPKKR